MYWVVSVLLICVWVFFSYILAILNDRPDIVVLGRVKNVLYGTACTSIQAHTCTSIWWRKELLTELKTEREDDLLRLMQTEWQILANAVSYQRALKRQIWNDERLIGSSGVFNIWPLFIFSDTEREKIVFSAIRWQGVQFWWWMPWSLCYQSTAYHTKLTILTNQRSLSSSMIHSITNNLPEKIKTCFKEGWLIFSEHCILRLAI